MTSNEIYLGTDTGSLQLLSDLDRKFNINPIQFSREDRTASGRLVRDVITTKNEFTLRYKTIDGDDLITFLDLYDEGGELVLRVHSSVSNYVDYTVLMDPISRERLLARADGLWVGVAVVLREV